MALGVTVAGSFLLALLIDPRVALFQLATYGALVGRGGLAALLVGCLTLVLVSRPDRPSDALAAIGRQRLPDAAAVLLGYVLLLASYTTLKTQIPSVVPYYADPFLADLDHRLHGEDPWRLLHARLPGRIGDLLLHAYGAPWALYLSGTVLFAGFMRPSALRTRYLWSFTLALLVLGVGVATIGSSVGPVFYEAFWADDRYAELAGAFEDLPPGHGPAAPAAYLLSLYRSGAQGTGAGISAFPSVHCAVVAVNLWFWWRVHRLAGAAAALFAATILAGSVYTGWHYALDGYASFAGVGLIWYGVGRVQAASAARRQPPTRTTALPVFAPWKRPMKASGPASSPS